MKLNFQDSGKYAGIITTPVLGKILEEYRVKFVATLVASRSESRQRRTQAKVKNSSRDPECSVRIVIYGLKGEESTVGTILSEAGLYFQQPSPVECDNNVEYSNPHYLVRPGSSMPKLDGLSISSDPHNLSTTEKLDEVDQSQLMRIFDLASDDVQPRVTPSPRLRSSLKEYVNRM